MNFGPIGGDGARTIWRRFNCSRLTGEWACRDRGEHVRLRIAREELIDVNGDIDTLRAESIVRAVFSPAQSRRTGPDFILTSISKATESAATPRNACAACSRSCPAGRPR